MIRFLTFEQIHNKGNVGSTRLRVHNLIKYWPEAAIYKYGENPDVLIFQKVYMGEDYKFHKAFQGVKILDICDPDWLDNMPVRETVDAVDGVTVPTEPLAEYLRQITDKPVRVIPDRHDLERLPKPKVHKGYAKKIVWYGYKQNAELLKFAIPSIEALGLELTVISNEDPMAFRWATHPDEYQDHYTYKKYDEATIYDDLKEHDICVLPEGSRPIDRFKSNNKTTRAWLVGLPVAQTGDDLRRLREPKERQIEAVKNYDLAKAEYDVRLSVKELKGFIDELCEQRR
jgi:hypothetical protein